MKAPARGPGLPPAPRLCCVLALLAALVAGVCAAEAGQAGQADSVRRAGESPAFDGPPAPVAPEVIARDDAGGVTVRAVRVNEPLTIDGVLDEPFYTTVQPMSGFIQMEPENGAPATERTDVWLAFDERNVYVSFRNWDTDIEHLVATEMRRDGSVMFQGNDIVLFMFDTFYDRRNSVAFTVNPIGGRQDGQVTNELQYNGDWNPVWDVRTGRVDGGWTVEAVVPFKSLRYRPGSVQVWGFNAMRIKRSKNEISALTRLPAYRGAAGFQIASLAATAVGLEAPGGGRVLDVKPYVTADLTTDRTAVPVVSNAFGGDAGFDAKYSLTQNLTADLTVNTDFAQVEADEQQVNLTRFSLFFPEKREFFLENQGTFSFGGVPLGGNSAGSDAPILFYSRRIGLSGDREVALQVGGRVTGRAGPYSLGLVTIRTGEEEATAVEPTVFSVARAKRDIFSRSSVGVIYTGRSVAQDGPGAAHTVGVDGTFAFYESLFLNAYWARTATDDLEGDETSYRTQLDYDGDRYGLQLERLAVGDAFNPEVGFVRRDDMIRDFALARFSPRPAGQNAIRRFVYQASLEYIEDHDGTLETRERRGEFALEFQDSARLGVEYRDTLDLLPEPLAIGGLVVPAGLYRFDSVQLGYTLSPQRALSARLRLEHGTYYGGRKTTFGMSRGRLQLTNQLGIEPTYELNRVRLRQGPFTTHVGGARVTYTFTPLMFASSLAQYNSESHAVAVNTRLRWEYQPGSELFVVYDEGRDTGLHPSLAGRSLIVKINRLFRW